MTILVTYATRYGATGGIADRIAEQLRTTGQAVHVLPVDAVDDVADYDAFVVGSAVYIGRWLPAAARFVREHAELLRERPVWLFSSGPLGDDATDARGRDKRDIAAPSEYAEFQELVSPVDAVVFYGALVPHDLSFKDRTVRRTPVGRELLVEGDFRDWSTIETWASEVGRSLDTASRT